MILLVEYVYTIIKIISSSIIPLGILISIGFIVGRKFPKIWKVLILLTIPWIIIVLLLYPNRMSQNGVNLLGLWGGGLLVYLIVLIGVRLGIWAKKRKDATTKIIISK
jgi:hypothetical protein